jgi:hypothetical protein
MQSRILAAIPGPSPREGPDATARPASGSSEAPSRALPCGREDAVTHARDLGDGWSERERRYKEAYDAVERLIEDRYGIPVVITDVQDPNTGDFDGATIKLDYANDLELSLFVLAHLFGHTIQWANCDEFRRLGIQYATTPPPEELWETIRQYEEQASRYSLQLFHDAGVTDLDQWLSDWAQSDWDYLANYYRTGESGDFRAFYRPGRPVLEPLPIPDFAPKRWVSRFSY